MKLARGYALSHSSFMVSQPELAPVHQRQRVFGALDTVRMEIDEIKPDVAIVIGTDHFNTFSGAPMPQWCVGRQEEYIGWGDNVPVYKIPGRPDVSAALLDALLAQGFEPGFSDEMPLDHSFTGPLHFVAPKMQIPIVPIFQNTIQHPMVALRRSYDLGRAIGRALRDTDLSGTAVILGSGGISHWIGGPEHGRVNPEFDAEFMRRFETNDIDWLTSLTSDQITELAGNGGQEVRNWVTVRGAISEGTVEVLVCEPIPEWILSVGVARLTPLGMS